MNYSECTTETLVFLFLLKLITNVVLSVFWSHSLSPWLKGAAKKFADVCRTRKSAKTALYSTVLIPLRRFIATILLIADLR